MLNSLREKLDEIDDDWEHKFVEGLLIQEDEGRDFSVKKLTPKQFKCLVKIHDRWRK